MNQYAGHSDAEEQSKHAKSLRLMTLLNMGVWAISLIALIFVMQHSPAASGMFPILAGGAAVGIATISAASKIH